MSLHLKELYHFQPLCLPSGSAARKMRKEHQSPSAPRQGSHTPNLLKHAAPDTSAHNHYGNNPCEAPSLTHSGTLSHAGTGNVCGFVTTSLPHVKHSSSGLRIVPCQAGESLFPQKFKGLFRDQASIQGTHGRRMVKSALYPRMKKTTLEEEEEKKGKRCKSCCSPRWEWRCSMPTSKPSAQKANPEIQLCANWIPAT